MSNTSRMVLMDLSGGDINTAVMLIQKAFRIGLEENQVGDVSHLKGSTQAETAANIWRHIRANTRYKRDPAGFEDVKTPKATYLDGFGDCEDMTIEAGCIAWQLGEIPTANIVEQNNGGWSHIFLTIGDRPHPLNPNIRGYAIDAVPEICCPDAIAPNLTRVMRFRLLNGVDAQSPGLYLSGLAGLTQVDSVTQMLMARRDTLLALYNARTTNPGAWTPREQKELRKTLALIQMNGTPERDKILPLMPEIDDVSNDGVWIWKHDADLSGIAGWLADDDEVALAGIFNKKKAAPAGKPAPKPLPPAKAAQQKQPGKVGAKIVQAAKKVAQAAVKYNPLTLAIRGGLLLALNLNLFRLSSKLRYLYMPESEAAKRGLNISALKRFQARKGKIEKVYTVLGGDLTKWREAIEKGAAKRDRKQGLKGLAGMEGLGVVETAALVAAGTAIAAIVKEIGPDGVAALKDLFAGSQETDPYATEGLPSDADIKNGLKLASEGATSDPAATGFETEEQMTAAREALDAEPDEKDNTMLYVGLAAALGIGLYVATK